MGVTPKQSSFLLYGLVNVLDIGQDQHVLKHVAQQTLKQNSLNHRTWRPLFRLFSLPWKKPPSVTTAHLSFALSTRSRITSFRKTSQRPRTFQILLLLPVPPSQHLPECHWSICVFPPLEAELLYAAESVALSTNSLSKCSASICWSELVKWNNFSFNGCCFAWGLLLCLIGSSFWQTYFVTTNPSLHSPPFPPLHPLPPPLLHTMTIRKF